MIVWPDNLVRDLVEGRCVIFLGAGISCNSTNTAGKSPKSWKDVLLSFANKVVDNKKKKSILNSIVRSDYLMACELVKNILGDDVFNDLLKSEFLIPGFLPSQIHKEIFKLDAAVVITPNFDKIYDTYIAAEAKGTIPILNYYSDDIVDFIRSGTPIVLKIHGTIDEPAKLIFSKKDYAFARNCYASFYKLLEALILTKTFLFLGSGLNDPDIQLLLENHCFQYRNRRKHYFVVPEKQYSRDELTVYESTLNLSFLEYKWRDRSHYSMDFLESISELSKKVETEKESRVRVS